MKIAVMSDIHGNSLALDAALADLQPQGIDAYWILGDLVALGPDPIGVLERITTLKNCHCIRGNTDRYVTTGDRPPPHPADVYADPEKLKTYGEVAGTLAWTLGAVTAAGWLEWLSALPLELHQTLPDGTRVLAVHASPGKDDSVGINKDTSDAEIERLLQGCEANLVCVGHTHQPVDRSVGRWRILNPGSLSNPRPPIQQAGYAILTAATDGIHIEHRAIDFDREKVIAQLNAQKHPGAGFIIKHMRGLHR